MDIRIAGTVEDSIVDGPGLRFVVFVQGCPHHCEGCHNPETHDFSAGKLTTTDALYEMCMENPLCSGVTFSGGDPLHWQNRKETGELIEEIHEKFPEKTIWLYTGFLWEDIKDLPFLKYVDVLVDGPFVEAEKDVTLHWKGSANQRVIDVKKSLEQGSVVLYESK